jgi:hypothetical protein
MSVIPALRRPQPPEFKFKVSLDYIMKLSQNQNKTQDPGSIPY